MKEALKANAVVLNYALTLENLENAFYRNGLASANLTRARFNAAGYNDTVYNYITQIGVHEQFHVSNLTTTLAGLGFNTVAECTYNFDFSSVAAFLATSSALENTGVSAYDYGAQLITNPDILQTAATIATVEARHASFVNNLINTSPFPAPYDTPLTIAQVLNIVTTNNFIAACPPANSQCNGVASTSSSVCSGQGTCQYTVCVCNSGFGGNNCQNAISTPTPSPAANPNIPSSAYSFESLKPNLQVLNYALTLEHLEKVFYRNNLPTLSAFQNAGYSQAVYNQFVAIQTHEQIHADNISTIITTLGGNPVAECTYNFNAGTVPTFLSTAQLLENTGVSAYDGAIRYITVPSYATTAATIATVEGRHASYINNLVGQNPFPSAYDTATPNATIITAITPILNVCPAQNSQCNGASGTSACNGRGSCVLTICNCNSGFIGKNCEYSTSASSATKAGMFGLVATILTVFVLLF